MKRRPVACGVRRGPVEHACRKFAVLRMKAQQASLQIEPKVNRILEANDIRTRFIVFNTINM